MLEQLYEQLQLAAAQAGSAAAARGSDDVDAGAHSSSSSSSNDASGAVFYSPLFARVRAAQRAVGTSSVAVRTASSSSPGPSQQQQQQQHQQHQAVDSPRDWLTRSLPELISTSQVLDILRAGSATGSYDEQIAAVQLVELLGDEHFELVTELIQRRQAVLDAFKAPSSSAVPERALNGHGSASALSRDGSTSSSLPPSRRAGGSGTATPTYAEQQQHQHQKRNYTPGAQLSFQTASEIAAAKRARKAAARAARSRGTHGEGAAHNGFGGAATYDDDDDDEEDEEARIREWERLRAQELAAGPGPAVSGRRPAIEEQERYPGVFISGGGSGSGLARVATNAGTRRVEHEEYEETIIPAPEKVPQRRSERLVNISEMDVWNRKTFQAYETLNRLQSIVYPVAYGSSENMLVCAPTGAGKTDVALLTILRCLSTLHDGRATSRGGDGGDIAKSLPPSSTYKIVYVAPLKALAAEITRKFATRLSWAGVKVRELTGDMKLTRREIDDTGIIVTTPEKWDVVTRRGSGARDEDVADQVRLLIIDEVHLLNEDRGAVIESIVARTLRQVESSQKPIRIVGLSATLPNYVDVADFLGVNRHTGLFYFDGAFRPVPLEQHFIGVKAKPRSNLARERLDSSCFDKVAELLRQGHQVMVFVHARKETVKTAQMLWEKAQEEGIADLLDPTEHDKWGSFKRDLQTSRNKEMKDLAGHGFGIHHAGMLRSDRNITEKMFASNVTKVLCCTATLAWGVNLPAYAVIIKGTQVYDADKGTFVDLSILDVLQIFGRAGRPQYESQGVGYICTTSDKVNHYISSITHQLPIESKFTTGLVDSLNAEISLGTVSTVDEGVRWLGYSYLFVRMRKNPLVYGMTVEQIMDDPLLGSKRLSLMTNSAKRLAECQMVTFSPDQGTLVSTDLGRIASKYYIRSASIEIFNQKFRPKMTEADLLGLASISVEFEQIQVRENEVPELKMLQESAPCQVRGGTDTGAGKVNILLQAYISRNYIEDFALVSDMGFVAQNAGRVVRALLEIAFAKKWATAALSLTSLSKAIEKRMWPFEHPLRQCDLPAHTMHELEQWADDYAVEDLAAMSDADIGKLIHQNERIGAIVGKAAREFPTLTLSHSIQPLSHDMLRVSVALKMAFEWSDKRHGASQAFWIWVEDEDSEHILQMTRVVIRHGMTDLRHSFLIPFTTIPSKLFIRVVSDRWIAAEDVHEVLLDDLVVPPPPPPPTPLLELPLLTAADTLRDEIPRALYSKEHAAFDPVVTQAFHTIYHTSSNALICTTSSSRSILGELAIWRSLHLDSSAHVVVLAPRRALARQMLARLHSLFGARTSVSLVSNGSELDGHHAGIAVVTPSALARAELASFHRLDLVVATDIHALDAPYELAVLLLRCHHPGLRLVGTSSSVMDAQDASDWFGVPDHALYAFEPSVRTIPLTTSLETFAIPHSYSLLRTMARPVFKAMCAAPTNSICFLPSRGLCKSIARELVTLAATEAEGDFASTSLDVLLAYSQQLTDSSLSEGISQGIGILHDDLAPNDRRIVRELFFNGSLRVLLVPRESCWTLDLTASVVIVMSAQYAALNKKDEREIRDYTLEELLRMQDLAKSPVLDHAAHFMVLCQAEQGELYRRYFATGPPLESALQVEAPSLLASLVWRLIAQGRLKTRQDLVDLLSWSFYARRISTNPCFYAALEVSGDSVDSRLSRAADELLSGLERLGCVALLPKTTGQLSMSLLGTTLMQMGCTLAEVEYVQSQDVDRLLGGIQRPPPCDADALKQYFARLPRVYKDVVGAGEAAEDEARVLLVGFKAGRLVRQNDALERRQVDLVRMAFDRVARLQV